jgi:putative transposase
MEHNPYVHHRRSIRLPHWDYRANGAYFVTICTHGRECVFDDSGLRTIVEDVWQIVVGPGEGPGEFIVMPNHVHGIVWIIGERDVERAGVRRRIRDGLDRGSLPVIVRTFKSATTKRINSRRKMRGCALWQDDYYERIIRNDGELAATRQYILDNPRKWAEDPDNPTNLRHSSPGSGRRRRPPDRPL